MGPKSTRAREARPLRDERGRLLPGQTANPRGANQYTRRNRLREALSTLAQDVPPESTADRRAIWSRFIDLAKSGDPWAVKEYLARRWPAHHERDSTAAIVVVRDYSGVVHERAFQRGGEAVDVEFQNVATGDAMPVASSDPKALPSRAEDEDTREEIRL